MPKVITVTAMMRSFSDIIGRVYYRGESFDITKGANVVARILPPKVTSHVSGKELAEIFENAPHLDDDDIADFEKSLTELRAEKDNTEFNKWD